MTEFDSTAEDSAREVSTNEDLTSFYRDIGAALDGGPVPRPTTTAQAEAIAEVLDSPEMTSGVSTAIINKLRSALEAFGSRG